MSDSEISLVATDLYFLWQLFWLKAKTLLEPQTSCKTKAQ